MDPKGRIAPREGPGCRYRPPGRVAFVRELARLWSDLARSGASAISDIDLAEREDTVITAYLLATQDALRTDCPSLSPPHTAALARAGEYLRAHLTHPVSRAEVAAAADVSIRSLSRGFARRWGTGPMGFLKARRMEAAYRELLGAAPGEKTVTEVACR